MLKLISLHTIDNIFQVVEKEGIKISPAVKMLYINVIMHHFRGKEPKKENAMAFEIKKSEMPEFHKYESSFQKLQGVDLVQINPDSIYFINRWMNHIDQSLFDKRAQEITGFNNKASVYVEKMLKDAELHSVASMKAGTPISVSQYKDLVMMFAAEKDLEEVIYGAYKNVKKDFIWYVGYNKPAEAIKKVVSKSKVLGKD